MEIILIIIISTLIFFIFFLKTVLSPRRISTTERRKDFRDIKDLPRFHYDPHPRNARKSEQILLDNWEERFRKATGYAPEQVNHVPEIIDSPPKHPDNAPFPGYRPRHMAEFSPPLGGGEWDTLIGGMHRYHQRIDFSPGAVNSLTPSLSYRERLYDTAFVGSLTPSLSELYEYLMSRQRMYEELELAYRKPIPTMTGDTNEPVSAPGREAPQNHAIL
jgi:hypothetical protein